MDTVPGQINLDQYLNHYNKSEPIRNPKVGSCFSGIGMWELALKYLEIEHEQKFFIEWDKYPAASYKAIHGDIRRYEDATKVDVESLEDIDVFFYSPPCQAFSVAGKGLGAEEERGLLFNDALRIIKAKKPKICIMENVKGLTNQKHLEFFKHILDSLDRAGYTNQYKILNTKHFGVPQNRERIFIVSIRNDIYKGFEFPVPFDNCKRLKDVLESVVDEKYYLSDEITNRYQFKPIGENVVGTTAPSSRAIGQRDIVFNVDGTMGALVATDYKQPKQILVKEATKQGYAVAQEGDSINLEHPNSETRRGRVGVGVAQTLTCSCNQAVVEPMYIGVGHHPFSKKYEFNGYHDKECPTLLATDYKAPKTILEYQSLAVPNEINVIGKLDIKGDDYIKRIYSTGGISPAIPTMQGGNQQPKIVSGFRIRKLTPKECFRLQGIKDEDFNCASEVNSNSQLYKQAGNGVSVNVVMEIIKKLVEFGYIYNY